MSSKYIFLKGEIKMSVKNLLTEEIQNEIEAMGKQKLGSDEHKATAGTVSQLMDRKIKLDELSIEQQKVDNEKEKLEIERLKAENEAKNEATKNKIAIGTFAISAGVTVGSVFLNYIMEERGTIISTKAGHAAINRALDFMFKKH